MDKHIVIKDKSIEIWFPFNEQTVERVKTLPDRRYKNLRRGRFWVIPASPYHAQQVLNLFGNDGFSIDPELRKLAASITKVTEKATAVEAPYLKDLYPFQAAAVQFLKTVGGRAILADEMGLGKTVEALTYARLLGDRVKQTVIVAPASVTYKWKNECERWLGKGWSAEVVEKTKGDMVPARVLIMSYAVATARYLQLVALRPDLLIMDEAHALKGEKSQRARAFKQYAVGVPFILALSASPFLNRPQELWNILHVLDPLTWNKAWDFYIRYCGYEQTYFGWQATGATNQEELAQRLKTVMVRRLKKDVLEQLPALRRVILPVKIDMKEYKLARKNRPPNALAWLNQLRQIVGKGKAAAAIEWAKDFLESTDEKLVIYAHHHEVVETLEMGLSQYGVTSITGLVTSNKERAARVEAFQTKPRPRVMIISSAGGEGIDLFAASSLLFVEREWTPMTEEQVEGRLHRIGQPSAVIAYYLAAQHTMDAHLAKLVDEKRKIFHEIIGGATIETQIQNEILEVLEKE